MWHLISSIITIINSNLLSFMHTRLHVAHLVETTVFSLLIICGFEELGVCGGLGFGFLEILHQLVTVVFVFFIEALLRLHGIIRYLLKLLELLVNIFLNF